MKTKNYLKLILLFSLICTPFFGQQTSEEDDDDRKCLVGDHHHICHPCDQTVHGTFNLPILMNCGEQEISITSTLEDGNMGTIIYGGLESDTRIQILPGHTSVRIIPWEEENDSIGNVIQTHTTTRLRNGNLGIVEDENYNYTDTEDKSSSKQDKKIGKETVKVFPNPFTNVLQMTSQAHPIVAYQIKDLYGKTIQQKTIKATYKQVVSVSELQKGVYLLSLYFQNDTQQQETIIKH